MTPLRKKTIAILEEHGFKFSREGKKHTIYLNPKTGQTIPVKRHKFTETTMEYILKEAGIKK